MRADCKREYAKVIRELKKLPEPDYEYFVDLHYISKHGLLYDEEHKYEYKKYTDYIKEVALKQVNRDEKNADKWRGLYWDTIKAEAGYFFESFLYYMERKRPYEKRFYEPRKKTLHVVVEDLQELEDSKDGSFVFYGLSMPSRVGKSTICIFFLAWIMLKRPNSHNAMGGHSGPLAKSFYKEVLNIVLTEEYSFEELYQYYHPGSPLLTDKSAEDYTITLDKPDRFATLTCKGIDGTWIGAIDVSGDGYLYVDDLVKDRMQSLSPKRMNDTYAAYLNQMVDRRNPGSKQLMVGTLWNVLDPLKRLENMYGNDTRYRFRKIPALNENDESNFDYEYYGFDTKWYLDMRDQMIKSGQEADWQAKFMQNPYVREGILFPLDELRYFNGILPQDHKYSFVTVCDVAYGGGDSVSMPIGLQDEDTNWIYIIDWLFDAHSVKITVPGVCDMLMKYGIREVTFERNSGGQTYAQLVQEELEKRNYICSCNTKPAPNNISKEDKIKGCEGKIKTMIIFLDDTKHDRNMMTEQGITYYERSAAYERALAEMAMFVTIGKNEHDDAPDSIAQLVIKAFGDMNSMAEVEPISRAALGM